MLNAVPTHIHAGLKKKTIPLHYLTSQDEHGSICYLILACPYQALQHMLRQATPVNAQDYGVVVASGFGTVPRAIRRKLVEEYGFNLPKGKQ